MKIASRMMIGKGIPINQSNNPRPNPTASSCVFVWSDGQRRAALYVPAMERPDEQKRPCGTAVKRINEGMVKQTGGATTEQRA
jgi:hypothetical protein